jgi:hypothetical protein
VRSALPNSDTACVGAFVGYGVELSDFGVGARFSSCMSELNNVGLDAQVLAHDVELSLRHAWDRAPFALDAAIGSGLSLFDQSFETRGSAPRRTAVAPFVALGLGAQLDLSHGFYSSLGLAGETHFLRITQREEPDGALTVGFALRATLAAGKHF